MKLLEHHTEIAALCGTLTLTCTVEWLAERVIAYVRFMAKVVEMIAGWF